MKVDRQTILRMVYASIDAMNERRNHEDDRLELEEATPLLARRSKLDSLGLVNLIVDVEQRLADELGLEVSLTGESGPWQNPEILGSIGTLTDYITRRLCGDANG